MVDCSKSFCSLHMPYLKLGSTPFARRYLEYRGFFLFLGVLRCFSSPGIPFIRYGFTPECWEFVSAGFPIRTSVDRCVFATPHSFSQLIASFIGSWCQGIHRMLFLTWPYDLFVEIVILNLNLKIWFYDVLVFDCICNCLGSIVLHPKMHGGPGWTRTTDLTLIRRAL